MTLIAIVMLNLVANAQDAPRHAAAPRSIVMAGVTHPENAIVEVRDTGPGIPAETRARIFEPLFTTKARGCVFRLTFPIAPPVADPPSRPHA